MKKFQIRTTIGLLFGIIFMSLFVYNSFAQSALNDSSAAAVTAVADNTPAVISSASQVDWGFSTFAALVAVIPFLVQLFKKVVPSADGLVVQIFSWAIGILITMIIWFFNIGFLNGIEWWLALLYGFGASLAANGVFKTGIIESILSVFTKTKKQ